jgi:hypothetical protein
MVKAFVLGLCAVLVAAVLYTVARIIWMVKHVRLEPDSSFSYAIDYVSFARNYLFTARALIVGALIFVVTFLVVTLVKRR